MTHPDIMIFLLIPLALLLWMAAYAWYRWAKYNTDSNRKAAAQTASWVFGFAALTVAAKLFLIG